jgi:hypothetical protein
MGQEKYLSAFNSVIFLWYHDNHNIFLFTLYHINDSEGYACILQVTLSQPLAPLNISIPTLPVYSQGTWKP